MIRVGIAGFGYSARTFHLPFIEASDVLELAAVGSSRRAAVLERCPGVEVYESAVEMIDAADVDLVIVTAPNEAHFDLCRRCLERGLHVVVEKPMATSSAQAADLVEIAARSSRVLSVFQNRRWDGDFMTVQQLVADRAVGEPRVFESHFDRFRPAVRQRWRELPGAGTGLWWDLGPHLVDQSLSLFGMPEALTARTLALREGGEATDYFHVLLHYRDLEVLLHGSLFSASPNLRFQLQGTAGSYVKFGLDPQEAQLLAGMLPGDRGFGVEAPESHGTLYTDEGENREVTLAGRYRSYYERLANAIQHGAAPPVPASEVVPVIRILELADDSQRQGRTIEIAGSGNGG